MSASSEKGTKWAKKIVDYLIEQGWPHAEHRNKNGAKDRGDITGVVGAMIEAKNEKGYKLAEWSNEAEREKAEAKASVGVVWAHRVGKASAADGYVIMSGAQFVQLLKEAGYQ